MRYWISTLLGLLVCAAALVAVNWGIYHLVRTGTCASGGPYVSARPCPPETAGHIGALMGGIFGGLIGMGIYAARGGRGRKSPIGLGAIMWFLLFCSLAASTAVAAFGPANNDTPGSKTAAYVLAGIFVPMGVAPLFLSFLGRGVKGKAQRLLAEGKRCPGTVISVEDTGMTINDNPRVKMTVRAEPPGEAPFTVEKTAVVSRVKIPREGDRCTVFYDPNDREQAGITFDQVPAGFPTGSPVLAPQPVWPVAAAPQAPAAAPPVSPIPPVPMGAADDGEETPLEKLQKLGELRKAGIVTAEEFEAQKQKLLGEL